MHCPASFRPMFLILIVNNIPSSDDNLGNNVPRTLAGEKPGDPTPALPFFH